LTGAELRVIRDSFGLTQQQFGEAVGLSGTHCGRTIRSMEGGDRPVNPLIARCAELLVENRRLRGRSHKSKK